MTRVHSPNTKRTEAASVVVLLSGGLDSAACAGFFRSQHDTVAALFVDYGQGARREERRAARRIAEHYEIQLSVVKLSGLGPFGSGFVPGRNLLLLAVALSHASVHAGLIALGIHSGTSYADCSQPFVAAAQRMFDIYTGGRARLACPFLDWTKAQLWSFCRETGVPVESTYSCERGGDPPCGTCLSCKDREALRDYQ